MGDENKFPSTWMYSAYNANGDGFSKGIKQPSIDVMNDMYRKLVEEVGKLKYSNVQKLETIASQTKTIAEQHAKIEELKKSIDELESRGSNEFTLLLQAHAYGHDSRCSIRYNTCGCDCGYAALNSYLGDHLFK